jgi:hypothetical protein
MLTSAATVVLAAVVGLVVLAAVVVLVAVVVLAAVVVPSSPHADATSASTPTRQERSTERWK